MGPIASPDVEWSEEEIQKLRQLWDEGYSSSVIGRRLGRSKNSIVGKVRRAGLPARPSPLKTQLDPTLARAKDYLRRSIQRQRTRGTLPPLPSVTAISPFGLIKPTEFIAKPMITPKPRAEPKPKPKPQSPWAIPKPSGQVAPCCWPLNNGRPWRFCGGPSAPGKPYCDEHCAVAYRPFRENACAA